MMERVAVPVEVQGRWLQHWWGRLQVQSWFGGLTPDSTPKRLGVRVCSTERRRAEEAGRDRITAALDFPVEARKVRVRVYGHPTDFVRTAQADVHWLVGAAVKVVGTPIHLAHSLLEKTVFDVFLAGLPEGWTGGVLDTPRDSRQPVKRYVPVCNAPRAASSYREVGRGRAVPQVVPAPPAPLQDEGGPPSDMETGNENNDNDGKDEGMLDGGMSDGFIP